MRRSGYSPARPLERCATKPNGVGGQHVDLTLAALQKVSVTVARGDKFYADARPSATPCGRGWR